MIRIHQRHIRAAAAALLAAPSFMTNAADEAEQRAAIERSLALIQRSAITAIAERQDCFTCHHTGLPVMTALAARKKGFTLANGFIETQLAFTAGILGKQREAYASGRGPGGAAFGAASALWTLGLGGGKPDKTTDTVADYVLSHRPESDFWFPPSIRPPAEESPFSATYVALESLGTYGARLDAERLRNRRDRALRWLRETPAKTTEDRVFRLLALAGDPSGRELVPGAFRELAESQREDGSWSQLPEMEGDAYATGTALVALLRSGNPEDRRQTPTALERGIAWLLRDQKPDGSWHVRSRADPFQKHFESGYPHGKDQFLSITAACWATTALLEALP